MMTDRAEESPEVTEIEWVSFPGGELEGQRPLAVCAACRARASLPSRSPLCFQCYRAGLERTPRAPSAPPSAPREVPRAPDGDRWQWLLPFEPVNRARLEMLRAERAASRRSMQTTAGRFVDQRRRAQIAARHALQRIAASLQSRSTVSAVHAAELQLPESWLPFVVSR